MIETIHAVFLSLVSSKQFLIVILSRQQSFAPSDLRWTAKHHKWHTSKTRLTLKIHFCSFSLLSPKAWACLSTPLTVCSFIYLAEVILKIFCKICCSFFNIQKEICSIFTWWVVVDVTIIFFLLKMIFLSLHLLSCKSYIFLLPIFSAFLLHSSTLAGRMTTQLEMYLRYIWEYIIDGWYICIKYIWKCSCCNICVARDQPEWPSVSLTNASTRTPPPPHLWPGKKRKKNEKKRKREIQKVGIT